MGPFHWLETVAEDISSCFWYQERENAADYADINLSHNHLDASCRAEANLVNSWHHVQDLYMTAVVLLGIVRSVLKLQISSTEANLHLRYPLHQLWTSRLLHVERIISPYLMISLSCMCTTTLFTAKSKSTVTKTWKLTSLAKHESIVQMVMLRNCLWLSLIFSYWLRRKMSNSLLPSDMCHQTATSYHSLLQTFS